MAAIVDILSAQNGWGPDSGTGPIPIVAPMVPPASTAPAPAATTQSSADGVVLFVIIGVLILLLVLG